jgi:glutathione S-transferase
MARPVLIYFASRGRAELIRIVCAEAGIEWDEHPVGKGTAPHRGRPTDFQALKDSGLLPFQAVPVWEEPDGFRLAQSFAIVGYLAATHGLRGKDAREAARCDEMLGAYEDVRGEFRKVFVADPDRRAALHDELATRFVPRWLGSFDRLLGSRAHLVGDDVSVADLALWYLLELVRDNGFTALDGFPRLTAFAARIAERPRIAAYARSPGRFPFLPIPR